MKFWFLSKHDDRFCIRAIRAADEEDARETIAASAFSEEVGFLIPADTWKRLMRRSIG